MLKATIREPLHVSRSELEFPLVSRTELCQCSFEVLNYSNSSWSTVAVTPSVEWLRCRTVRVGNDEAEFEKELRPRQVWRVLTEAEPHGLALGKHRATVKVEAHTANERWNRVLPVTLELTPAVAAVPSQLFFGELTRPGPVTRSFVLHFTAGSMPSDPHKIGLSHDLNGVLKLSLGRVTPRTVQIEATLDPLRGDGLIEGKVQVVPPDSLPTVTIPVIASIPDENG